MTLGADFQFSQSSLQDYLTCKRRFQLKYIQRLAWPSVQIEPIGEAERQMRLGQSFHRMIHQYLIGLGENVRSAEPELGLWWANFLQSAPQGLGERLFPETTLTARAGGYRFMAKYDLIALGERCLIFDWKTAPKRPSRAWLQARIQTRLYRFLLARAGTSINSGLSPQPDAIEMIYWFANFPQEPERLLYDDDQYRADENFLMQMAGEITHKGENDFPLTTDQQACRFCGYRSLCDRGYEVGSLHNAQEWEDESAVIIAFEDIEELRF